MKPADLDNLLKSIYDIIKSVMENPQPNSTLDIVNTTLASLLSQNPGLPLGATLLTVAFPGSSLLPHLKSHNKEHLMVLSFSTAWVESKWPNSKVKLIRKEQRGWITMRLVSKTLDLTSRKLKDKKDEWGEDLDTGGNSSRIETD